MSTVNIDHFEIIIITYVFYDRLCQVRRGITRMLPVRSARNECSEQKLLKCRSTQGRKDYVIGGSLVDGKCNVNLWPRARPTILYFLRRIGQETSRQFLIIRNLNWFNPISTCSFHPILYKFCTRAWRARWLQINFSNFRKESPLLHHNLL